MRSPLLIFATRSTVNFHLNSPLTTPALVETSMKRQPHITIAIMVVVEAVEVMEDVIIITKEEVVVVAGEDEVIRIKMEKEPHDLARESLMASMATLSRFILHIISVLMNGTTFQHMNRSVYAMNDKTINDNDKCRRCIAIIRATTLMEAFPNLLHHHIYKYHHHHLLLLANHQEI